MARDGKSEEEIWKTINERFKSAMAVVEKHVRIHGAYHVVDLRVASDSSGAVSSELQEVLCKSVEGVPQRLLSLPLSTESYREHGDREGGDSGGPDGGARDSAEPGDH